MFAWDFNAMQAIKSSPDHNTGNHEYRINHSILFQFCCLLCRENILLKEPHPHFTDHMVPSYSNSQWGCIGLVTSDETSTRFSVVWGRKSLEILDQFYIVYSHITLGTCVQRTTWMCLTGWHSSTQMLPGLERIFCVGRSNIMFPSYITSGNGMRFAPQESCSLTHLISETLVSPFIISLGSCFPFV